MATNASTGRTALVIGATGLVGGHLVARLLEDARWSRVIVLARRASGRAHGKLTEHIVDFEALANGAADPELARLTEEHRVQDHFSSLGTTIKMAGTQERFRRVDHDYTVAVARLAREAGAERMGFVSSVGAAEGSRNFYLRTKGETERDLGALGFPSLSIARPSALVGERSEARAGERVGIAVLGAVAPLMVGGLRAYRPIAARDVALALLEATAAGGAGTRVLTHAELVALRG